LAAFIHYLPARKDEITKEQGGRAVAGNNEDETLVLGDHPDPERDATVKVARQLGAKVISSPPGRACQLNAGAAVASSDYFYFLHADTLPPKNWSTLLCEVEAKGKAACFSLRFDQQEASSLLRLFSKLSHWDVAAFRFGDQSLFISRKHFIVVDGYQNGHILLEGNDIIRRIRAAGIGFEVLPGEVTTSARRYLAHGVIFTQLMFVVIYGLYRLGAPQVMLADIYRWAFANRAPCAGK